LERVELDHTVLDLIVVDEEDRLPIGRPTVTLALDVYSGLPAGLYVGFEPAGYGAAMRCLLVRMHIRCAGPTHKLRSWGA